MKINSKQASPLVPIVSREALDTAVAEVATLKMQYATIKAEIDLEIARIQESRRDQLAMLAKQIEIRESGVFMFCRQHRPQLFPEKKSIDFLGATVGYRTEPPSVEKKSRRDSWSDVASRLAETAWGQRYLHTPAPEIDKRALLSDREKLTDDQLDEVGLRFAQGELFYITPKANMAERSVLEAA